MLGYLFSNRWIQAAMVFLVVVVGGSLLYRWHVHREVEAERAAHERFLQERDNRNAAAPAERPNVPTENEAPELADTRDENPDTAMPADSEVLPNGDEPLDFADAFLPENSVSEVEAPAEAVAVSPFGFGAYPEVPADYPIRPAWASERYHTFSRETQQELELLDRVLIKLWNRGERGFRGGSTDNGKVYPHYRNTVYVRYETTLTGRRYIARYKGDPSAPLSPEQLRSGELPSHIRVLDIDSEGIDPYQFLGLK